MMPFYTYILRPEEYSVADLITQSAHLLIPIACLGICDGLFRFALDKNRDKEVVFSTGICVLTAISVVFLALSPLIFLVDYFKPYVWLIALYVVSANIHSAFAQYVRAKEKMRLFAIQGIVGTILTILLNILFLLVFEWGIIGYVLSVAVADILTSTFLFFYDKLYKSFKIKLFDWKMAKQMVSYSLPLVPTTICWWVTSVSDRYIVTAYLGNAVNGLYSAAYKIPTLLTLVSTCFIEAWHVSAVRDTTKEDEGMFFGQVFESYMGIIFTACAAIIALTKPLTILLYADDYYMSWRYIPVLVGATAFAGLVSYMGSVYVLKMKPIFSFITSITGALVNIGLNFLFIGVWGAMGAAIATFLSYFIVFVIRIPTTRALLKFNIHPIKILINTAIIILQMVTSLYEVRYWILIQIVAFATVVVINLRPIIKGVMQFLHNFMQKGKKI
jgi:O-antigen/teichoic acid export membrane protein